MSASQQAARMQQSAGEPALRFDWAREISEEDFAAMVRLLNEVALTTGTNGFSEPLTREQVDSLRRKLSDAVRSGGAHQLLVRVAGTGEIVGIATLETMSQPTRRHIVEIRRAAISLSHRGRVLKRAWENILERCREMGWELVQIDVSEDGPVKLWERFGFRTFGRVGDYARVGSRKLAGCFMILRVDPTTTADDLVLRRVFSEEEQADAVV